MRPVSRCWLIPALTLFLLAGCATHLLVGPDQQVAAANENESGGIYLSPKGFESDLITPAGIHVKTNGQYKTESYKRAASGAIDRYWTEVRDCAVKVVPADRTIREKLIPEFPRHLVIEIVERWNVIEGPKSHRKMQAFASQETPGAWITARREENALLIEVVPELDGLGRQMAGELNLYLAGNTTALPSDLSNRCGAAACIRFHYNNAPSQAWQDCID